MKLYVLSQRGDLKSGVAVGEGEGVGGLDELAAAEEEVAVGEFGVVLEATLLQEEVGGGRRELSGGCFRPLLDGVGEAVVHLEAEDTAVSGVAALKKKKKEGQE